jgi:hypothetical protein
MNHKITGLMLVFALTGTSCKVFKSGSKKAESRQETAPAVTTPPAERMEKKAADLAASSWSAFSGKGELNLDMNGNDLSLNATFRMKRDSVLWLSISPGMGITAARALITRDSVKVVNYLQKYYAVYSIAYLQELLGAPVSLSELQKLMLGLPLFDTATYRYDSLNFLWEAKLSTWTNRLFFEQGTLVSSAMADQNNSRSITANYQGQIPSRERADLYMPKTIRVKVLANNSKGSDSSVQESAAALVIEELSSASNLQFPLNIPANYERR